MKEVEEALEQEREAHSRVSYTHVYRDYTHCLHTAANAKLQSTPAAAATAAATAYRRRTDTLPA